MKFLTQNETRNAYNNGIILENRHNREYVIIFSLCGLHFSSTYKRARKGKQYKLDDKYWCKHHTDLREKILMILDRKVHLIRGKRC